MNLIKWLRSFRLKIKNYTEITGLSEVLRRYFTTNAFDGALTVLGVIVGAYVSGEATPHLIVAAGIGASVAMSISGFTGAYMTERAERDRDLREIEAAVFMDLDGTVYDRATSFASLFVALVDGFSPMVVSLVALSPFILVKWFPWFECCAFKLSLLIIIATLFLLGAYLGKLSGNNILIYGFKMMLVGLLTALILFLVSKFGVRV